jgi:hypothetical protein
MAIFFLLGSWSDRVATATAPLDGRVSSLIEQILSSARIVQSFDLAPRLISKLEYGLLRPMRKVAQKKAMATSLEQSFAFGAGFLVYSTAYWFGGMEILRGVTVGDITTVG